MKICYLCADAGIPLGGSKGASAHVRGLARAFRDLGHQVLLVSPDTGSEPDLDLPLMPVPAPEIVDAMSAYKNVRVGRALRHLWNNVAVEQALRRVLVEFGPDLLYERYSPFGIAGGIMAQRMGIRHILEVNAPLAWEGKEYRRQALQEAAETLEEAAFAATSVIVAVSEELREELVSGGVSPSRIAVVPNGVDTEMFSPQGPTRSQDFEGSFVIGFVGGLRPWHGIDELVEAFCRLASDPQYHLLIVGDGPLADRVRSLAERLPGRVTLTGAVPQSQVPAYLRAMDVAVAPYPALQRFYFSPLKALEYMAAGRAVVASATGQLNRLVKDGVTGVLVPPGDVTALAEAIRTLASDKLLRDSIGAAAAAEARSGHSWTRRATDILSLGRHRASAPAA